jgi:PAS domain S-box-containing protein
MPQSPSASGWPHGQGLFVEVYRDREWEATPLGSVETWPQSLRTMVDFMLGSRTKMCLMWGPSALLLYNEPYARWVAADDSRVLGCSAFEVWHDMRPALEPHFLRAFSGEEANVHAQPVRFPRTGDQSHEALIDLAFTPVRDESGQVAGVLVRLEDPTEQVPTPRALRASEARLAEAIKIQTVGVMFWGESFALSDMNEAFLRMTGFTREEALGKTWADLTPPEFHPLSLKAVEEVLTRGESTPHEKQYFRKDGSRWWGLFAARRVADEVVEFVVDVTARREAEERARAGEDRQAFLLQLSDALRPLSDAGDIQAEAARLLGEHLGSDRAYYVEVSEAGGEFVVARDWHRPDATSHAGRYPIDTWPLPWLANGRTWVVRDVDTDTTIRTDQRGAYRNNEIGAAIVVPLLKDDRLVGTWLTNQRTPREWTAREVQLVEEVAARTWDAVERARAEAVLREGEAQQAFLLELSDKLRLLADPVAVQEEASRILGEHLGLDRCAYGEVDETAPFFTVQRDYCALDLESVAGHHWRETYLRATPEILRRGESFVVNDVRSDPRLADVQVQREYAALSIAAFAVVPLVKAGRLLASLIVHQRHPRAWTLSEIQLLQNVADRTWGAVDRARAETALQQSEESFRAIVETAMDYAIFTVGPEGLITTWPAGAQAVFGWTAEEAVGQSMDMTFTPEDRVDGAPEAERLAARTAGQAPDVRWHLRKDGSRIFIDGITRPLRDEHGSLTGFVKVGQNVTERRATEEALRESDERFQQFSEASSDMLWIRDCKSLVFEHVSPAFERIYGVPRDGVLGGNHVIRWAELIHPDDRESAFENIRRVRGGERVQFAFRIVRPTDGQVRWVRNTDFPLLDAHGGVQRIGGISHDATEEIEVREQLELLVAELQHRTRNLIGVVTSIANQTMAYTGPTEAFREEFGHRLSALSRVQGLLSRAEQEPITLQSLIKLELDALGAEGDEVRLDGPNVRIRPRIVQLLALVVHELATNARKYGALSKSGGHLAVEWHLRREEGERRLFIEWRETDLSPTDIRPSTTNPGGGYGRRLIESALPYSLKARTTYELDTTQLRCTIDLPWERPANNGRSRT